ncbi:class I SAM-dependent methyltransferase [Pseudomonas sp. 10B1]|uniref:class I SAM-dependent methyltransferase n=1 Tax=unclassified Pseudomonas TaxID=196821 RepID=UPI002AB3319C|nr:MULTISPECIES: class I SAM-dependent methyltransferase [unclassified Pseudomonas]MDY7561229.1 class I SAM-dependent methyltransferase [Pseudomonas sp. AB6]MEA9995960.1 class I SAM-dependent methyltransferase [Pseudomonas sp. AA4]MEB0087658.1 class I SAM-dependent methyltransferase [Pseudomonas sp. RTI1]MEB0127761.1 class I SAM-dependent methyltransferase [Pseudomonas sp. CCC1.2]MEB0154156.1 class I SAM-dependent methyltransferase [Pseudomonas sp. CCC4.3]
MLNVKALGSEPDHSKRAPPHGFYGRLAHWRDEQLARRALKVAGEPGLVLDLPSGAGRFWSVLTEHSNRVVLAADHSPEMLALGEASFSAEKLKRIKTFQTSPLSIELSANAVDCIFCMRLFHHLADRDHRAVILREFHRVTRDTVIIALWVDGNIKSWRRKRLERARASVEPEVMRMNRFVVNRSQIESEFAAAGFQILGHHDVLPGYAMWRVYVLQKA